MRLLSLAKKAALAILTYSLLQGRVTKRAMTDASAQRFERTYSKDVKPA